MAIKFLKVIDTGVKGSTVTVIIWMNANIQIAKNIKRETMGKLIGSWQAIDNIAIMIDI